MLASVDIFQKYIEKWNEHVEHQKTTDKVVGMKPFKRPQRPNKFSQRQGLMACKTEYTIDYDRIESDLNV